ncbi:hypothetical protein H0H92_015001 [Tricholoma furcatifolium]|nr:hypothetical protein H0H92_015001 [Tricholoma furcatifolium]
MSEPKVQFIIIPTKQINIHFKQGPTVSPNKLAMSRALGAAFLNHQVEQLEKSVSGTTGPASGNWRRRHPSPSANQGSQPNGNNTKRPPMAAGIKVVNRRPGEESQAARKARAPSAGIIRMQPKEEERDGKDADIVVVDASVLVHALYQLKKWCRDGREEIVIVPLEALNTLDLLKKGTSHLAQRARAASRVLEAQVGTNPRIRVQQDDAFVLWDNIPFTANPSTSPEWVRRTICCAQWEVEAATNEAKKVILAVLSPTPTAPGPSTSELATSLNDTKLSSAPVPLPAPHILSVNKHEPRSAGTLVAQWAARANIETLVVEPTAGEDEAPARSKRGSRPRRTSDGSVKSHHPHGHGHGHGHGQGALVERPPAVMAMMEMVAQPSTVVRVLARGEKLDP